MKEGSSLVWLMSMAHALITGSNPGRLAVMRIIKTQLLRGVPPSLKPLIITAVRSATGNGGVLPNTLREIGAIIWDHLCRWWTKESQQNQKELHHG